MNKLPFVCSLPYWWTLGYFHFFAKTLLIFTNRPSPLLCSLLPTSSLHIYPSQDLTQTQMSLLTTENQLPCSFCPPPANNNNDFCLELLYPWVTRRFQLFCFPETELPKLDGKLEQSKGFPCFPTCTGDSSIAQPTFVTWIKYQLHITFVVAQ